MFMVIQAYHEQNFLQSSRYAIHAYHYLRISSFPTVPSGRIIGPCHLEKSSTFPFLLLLHLHAALPFDVAKRRNGKRREKKNHGEKDASFVTRARREHFSIRFLQLAIISSPSSLLIIRRDTSRRGTGAKVLSSRVCPGYRCFQASSRSRLSRCAVSSVLLTLFQLQVSWEGLWTGRYT